MKWFLVVITGLLCLTTAVACTPRVRVLPNPSPHDKGIRYYRPKPYLLVSSGVAETTVSEREKTVTTKSVPDPKYVNIQLVYLPDFEEEYAIDVRTGFGTADVEITLEEGWNLTGINQKLDSRTSENLTAIADLIGAVSKFPAAAATGEDSSNRKLAAPQCSVRATNVPLGYYESVLGRDAAGRKHLYGFRYIGFMPFAACPQSMKGVECGNCQTTDLYGLVFVNDAMVFRRLSEIESLGGHEQFETVASQPESLPLANVSREVQYDEKGRMTKATFSISDEYKVPSPRENIIYAPLPKLNFEGSADGEGIAAPTK